jgi:hypothetical protein
MMSPASLAHRAHGREAAESATLRVRRYVKFNRGLRAALFLAQNLVETGRSIVSHSGPQPSVQAPKTQLAAMVRVKNEARFLPEWLAHHVRVGVEHFYVYDNNSTDDTAAAIEPFISRGLVTLVPWSNVPASPSAHNDFFARFGGNTEWAMFLDADEFLMLGTPTPLTSILEQNRRWPAIALNSRYFGTGDHETIPAGLVTEQFVKAEDRYNDHVKVIAQPTEIVKYRNPHNFYYRRGRLARTLDGRRVFGSFVRTTSEPAIVVNHYLNRSREDYVNKRRRGYATAGGEKAQQRGASRELLELAKFNDVAVDVPYEVTRSTAKLLEELGYPDEFHAAPPDVRIRVDDAE